MARLPVIGQDKNNWGTVLNDFLEVSHRHDGRLKRTKRVFNVKDYGAAGNGSEDDTQAVQRAVDDAIEKNGGAIYFPSGAYRITDTIVVAPSSVDRIAAPLAELLPNIEIIGNGWSSAILWEADQDLFVWTTSCVESTIRDLKIISTAFKGNKDAAAFHLIGGAERSYFDHILVTSQEDKPLDNQISPDDGNYPVNGIWVEGTTDSTTIHQCQFWYLKGTGIRIGDGSEVRIEGGRVIGRRRFIYEDRSIGVHLTGNNGGVHLQTTDVIGLFEGVRIEDSEGVGSNREVFLTHATLDSCWRGLQLADNCYVSLAGCWAASCDHDNIHVEPGLNNPILSITGGTIFNAGQHEANVNPDPLGQNGLVVNSGTFTLTGVHIRDNLKKGVWIPNDAVREYTITGCRIHDNEQGAKLTGSNYLVTNNVFTRNTLSNEFGGSGFLQNNNVFV